MERRTSSARLDLKHPTIDDVGCCGNDCSACSLRVRVRAHVKKIVTLATLAMLLLVEDLIHERDDDDPCSQDVVPQGHHLPPRDEELALICEQ